MGFHGDSMQRNVYVVHAPARVQTTWSAGHIVFGSSVNPKP